MSVPLIIVTLTAMFTVHFQYGFSTIKLLAVTPAGAQFGPPGYEMNLLYIIGLLVLVLGGSGRYSLDGLLLSKFKLRKSKPKGEVTGEETGRNLRGH